MAPAAKKRKTSTVEEITFNPEARAEYLTGFHKRKLQRIKHAQDTAAKREREEKIADRKKLRDARKEEARKHVEEVDAILRKLEGSESDSSGKAEELDDESEANATGQVSDREEDYMDDDKHVTVTIESMDPDTLAEQPAEGQDLSTPNRPPEGSTDKSLKPKKKKKKKFRYESKAERKMTRAKERAGNKAKAKSRKE